MLTTAELAALAKQTAQIVRTATEPLLARIAELEAKPIPEKGDSGPSGKDGLPGKDGERGPVGIGEKGDRGEKGLDGQNGADAVLDYDQVLKAVDEVHERRVAIIQLDLEKRFNQIVRDFEGRSAEVIKAIPVPKDGNDGKDGRDGKDGISLETLKREYVQESHEIRESWTVSGKEHEIRYPAGGIRPAGYWKDSTRSKSGEAWTHDGTMWIALRDTTDKPSYDSKDWIIGARKGRDGRNGTNGKDAPGVVKLNGP